MQITNTPSYIFIRVDRDIHLVIGFLKQEAALSMALGKRCTCPMRARLWLMTQGLMTSFILKDIPFMPVDTFTSLMRKVYAVEKDSAESRVAAAMRFNA